MAQIFNLDMNLGNRVLEVFFYVLITTLPMSLIIYLIGRKRVGWVPGEFLLSFLPWIAAMVVMALTKDITYFDNGIFFGIFGGFTLLPRLFHNPTERRDKFIFTLVISLIIAAYCALKVATIGPAYRN